MVQKKIAECYVHLYSSPCLRVLKAHINKKRGLDMAFGQREYNEHLARKKFKKKSEKKQP